MYFLRHCVPNKGLHRLRRFAAIYIIIYRNSVTSKVTLFLYITVLRILPFCRVLLFVLSEYYRCLAGTGARTAGRRRANSFRPSRSDRVPKVPMRLGPCRRYDLAGRQLLNSPSCLLRPGRSGREFQLNLYLMGLQAAAAAWRPISFCRQGKTFGVFALAFHSGMV